MGSSILEVQNVSKKFRDFTLKNISFSLQAGYIMGLVGRNGAGKTTIMKLIMNCIKMDAGEIKVVGFDNQREERKARNCIGFVGEDAMFLEEFSLDKNGDLFGQYYDVFEDNLFRQKLREFSLPGNKLYSELSKGMRTKFQMAFAMAHHPKVLLLDEPTGGLDAVFRKEFLSILQEQLLGEDVGILLSTHLTSDLDKIGDYITMVEKGTILFTQEKESLLDEWREKGLGEKKLEDIMYEKANEI